MQAETRTTCRVLSGLRSCNVLVSLIVLIHFFQSKPRRRCLSSNEEYALVRPLIYCMELPVSCSVCFSNYFQTLGHARLYLCKRRFVVPSSKRQCLQVAGAAALNCICSSVIYHIMRFFCSCAIKLGQQCAAVLRDNDFIAQLGFPSLLSGTLAMVGSIVVTLLRY